MLSKLVQFRNRRRAQVADNQVTKGLRVGLLALTLMVIAACIGIVTSMQRLKTEVSDWSLMETVDARRELLQRTVQQFFASERVEGAAPMIDALALLYLEIEKTAEIDKGLFAAHAGASLSLARRQFNTALQTRSRLFETQEALVRDLNHLTGRTTQLRQVLSFRTEALEIRQAALDKEQQQVSDRQIQLANWLMAAMNFQLELEQLRPHQVSEFSERLLSNQTKFDLDDLPLTCAGPPQPGPLNGCSPEVLRLKNSIIQLAGADARTFQSHVSASRRAFTQMERVANAEYITLAERYTNLLLEQRDLRARVTNLEYNRSVLENISRSLLQVKAAASSVHRGASETDRPNGNATPFLFARMRFGGSALDGSVYSDVNTYANSLKAQTKMLEASWARLNDVLAEHEDSFVAFDRSMANIAQLISTKTETIRRETLLWVSLFATIAFGSAAAVLFVTLGAAHLARRRFILPLTKVTAAILGLARGKIERKIEIQQRVFGFDRLGKALEELRRAIADRQDLAVRNAEQTHLIQQNLAALEKTTDEMQWLAMHDPLTELGNRRAADQEIARLTEAWEKGWETGRPEDYCLIHLDIDHFKDINDTLGHDAGDFVLGCVADALRAVTGDRSNAYRIGGDEFLIIIAHSVMRDTVEPMVSGLLDTLSAPKEYQGHVCQTGASFGIAFGSDGEGDAQAVLANADIALYESKRAGRGTYRFFTDKLRQGMRRRTALANRLRVAVEEGQFVPYYQPQFNAHDLSLRGVETLCRWEDPEEGWLPPAQFLGIAEELHLMGQIDQHLFNAAARDIEYLQGQGLTLPRISFNVTAQRLAQTNLAQDLTRTITGETQIVVELLESMSLDNLSETVRFSIDALKEAGIMVEIDDFGSCRASIAGLISVGPDAMKIDKSIIQPLADSDQHLQLVKSIIQIGQTLSIEVVAEGVETEDHVKILTDLGCDILQGFALARPMSLENLEIFLRKGGLGRQMLSA